MVGFLSPELNSVKRKRSIDSTSPPDDRTRDPSYSPGQASSYPHGSTPPINALWQSKAPADSKKRAVAASEIAQEGICVLTHEVRQSSSGVQFAHVVASGTTGDTNQIRAVECVMGLPAKTFNVHSSRNMHQMAMKPHNLWDTRRIAFLPTDAGVMETLSTHFVETPFELRCENDMHEIFPLTLYTYMVFCIPPLLPETFIFHLKELEKDDEGIYRETGRETPYHSPFQVDPLLIKSHVSPALMALNTGEKLHMLGKEDMHVLYETYGEEIAGHCNQLRMLYQQVEDIRENLPEGFLSGAWLKQSVYRGEPPVKRSKVTDSSGTVDNDSFQEYIPIESLGPSTTLVDKSTSNVAPSVGCGPLFDDDTTRASHKPIGSRHKSLEGLTWENFTGQPFDYVDPYKAMEIYKQLEEQRCKPLVQGPTASPRDRRSRIPRLSPQPQASPASDCDEVYTPSRPPKSIPRNSNGQKIYSLKYTKSLARQSRPAESSPTPSPPKKILAPSFAGSRRRTIALSPTTKDGRADVPAPTVAAPSVVGSSRGRGNTAVVLQSRIPVPSSRLPVPSSKLSQKRFAQAKDAPLKHGQR